ncbi:MAG: patatin-like phospholipase family protein [Saprospiraceae bacterium]|nr:patatin-like phospholipase family protein [Saprospiraceae bacterium]
MPRIGISFSGGGARGIAHIGVVQALRENNIKVSAIAGSSAGSIIGALYAAGVTVEDMLNLARQASLWKTVKWGIPLDGLAKMDLLIKLLEDALPVDNFEELEIPFFVAVSNLLTGEPEIFNHGPIAEVVAASSSIPLVFKPRPINGQLYVDGGVMLNLPVEPLTSCSDYIIGVNVRPRVPIHKKEVQSFFGIAQRVFDLSLQGNMRPGAAICDMIIAPEGVSDYGLFQFNKVDELYEIGYEAGLDAVERLQEEKIIPA